MKRKAAGADAPAARSPSPVPSAVEVITTVPNFIAKTYAMVQDASNSKAVRWGKSGNTIVIDHVRDGR